jgi:dTDP-4-dehydrorhamnose 3,5-epimerase
MNFNITEIEGLVLIETKKFHDSRGHFFESYQQDQFRKFTNQDIQFVQENESSSKKNVIRGLHFQKPPFSQGKLVRVPYGKVLDVAVDIRVHSKTYGKYLSFELSAENGLQLWIPEGFAHGFVALDDNSLLSYKCTNYYNKNSEDAIVWNDPQINIDWKVNKPILSDKDESAQNFSTFESPF